MSNDISWAVGEFLFILFTCILFLNLFSYLLELLTTKVTWHPPPLLQATAHRVLHGWTTTGRQQQGHGDDEQRGENDGDEMTMNGKGMTMTGMRSR